MSLQSMLPYVTPPVVGAVIGYVTNDIAIRMLFRPLKHGASSAFASPSLRGSFRRAATSSPPPSAGWWAPTW
ncbi:hypothetical protein [Geobacter anodireducens]